MTGGKELIEFILVSAGTLFLTGAFILACLESSRGEGIDEARVWLADRWKTLIALPARSIPIVALRWTRDVLDKAVGTWLADFDRSHIFAPLVIGILGVGLPAAALLNASIGGSPVLALMYLSGVLLVVLLNVLEAVPKLGIPRRLIAAATGLGWFLIMPLYALQSFFEHVISAEFGHALLVSMFLVVLCYATTAGAWTLFRSGSVFSLMGRVEKFIARFMFAVPFTFALYWAALVFGLFAEGIAEPGRDWTGILSVMIVGSIAFAATAEILDAGVAGKDRGHPMVSLLLVLFASSAATVLIDLAAGYQLPYWVMTFDPAFDGALTLGSGFWLSHIPFVLFFVIVIAVLFLGLARLVAFSGGQDGGWILRWPFAAASACFLFGGVLSIGSAVSLA